MTTVINNIERQTEIDTIRNLYVFDVFICRFDSDQISMCIFFQSNFVFLYEFSWYMFDSIVDVFFDSAFDMRCTIHSFRRSINITNSTNITWQIFGIRQKCVRFIYTINKCRIIRHRTALVHFEILRNFLQCHRATTFGKAKFNRTMNSYWIWDWRADEKPTIFK